MLWDLEKKSEYSRTIIKTASVCAQYDGKNSSKPPQPKYNVNGLIFKPFVPYNLQ